MGKVSLTHVGLPPLPPIVEIKKEVGLTFVGEYVESKEVSEFLLHLFKIKGGTAKLSTKVDGVVKEVTEVQEDDLVAMFGTTQVNRAIEKIKPGDVVEFIYKGKGQKKSGFNAPHRYEINLLTND